MRPARASSTEGAVQQVIGALTADIADGRLPPGARLTEAALAARFGLSRGPVREALRHLAVQGLLAHRRHAGAEVRRLTRVEIRALFDLREVTEGLAARLAAAHATAPEAASRLRAALAALDAAAAAKDVDAFGAANAAFHAEIVTWPPTPTSPMPWRGYASAACGRNSRCSRSPAPSPPARPRMS